MRKIIGIIAIIGGAVLGYFGYDKLQDSKAGIKIGELELEEAEREAQQVAPPAPPLGSATTH